MLLSHKHKLRGFTRENEQPAHVKICQGVACARSCPFLVYSPITYSILYQNSYRHIDHRRIAKTIPCIVLFHRVSGAGITCLGAYRQNFPLQIKIYKRCQGQVQDFKNHLSCHVKLEHVYPITSKGSRFVWGGGDLLGQITVQPPKECPGILGELLPASSGLKNSLQSHALKI